MHACSNTCKVLSVLVCINMNRNGWCMLQVVIVYMQVEGLFVAGQSTAVLAWCRCAGRLHKVNMSDSTLHGHCIMCLALLVIMARLFCHGLQHVLKYQQVYNTGFGRCALINGCSVKESRGWQVHAVQ
jgi:hypothetical protein